MPEHFSTDRLERYAGVLWGLVLLTLPVTTFRYIPSIYSSTSVRPLALYPLALLFPILLLLAWRVGNYKLPRVAVPMVAFLLVAMGATLIGALYAPLDLRGQSFEGRALRAWFSVAIGLIFFLSAYWMNRTQDDLRRPLTWMYAGLAA
ncbi:MAG: hypothetical protein IH859_09915, partial [Chloroflexi bacterium]|nr:hypothetical protein [Chloroflexota bacterium]